MKVSIVPRFETIRRVNDWYVLERDLIGVVCNSILNLELSVLMPESIQMMTEVDLVIICGGDTPGANPHRDAFEAKLVSQALSGSFALLGICRGSQLIAVETGSLLLPVTDHVDSDREVVGVGRLGRCFHKYGVFELSNSFQVLSRDKLDDSIALFQHKDLPIIGIQSHPERDPNGVSFLKNLVSRLKI